MDNDQKEAIIEHRLKQAEEAGANAELLYNNTAHAAAINRIYYAMFYAVVALALRNGFSTSKHGQLIGWFNREFIKSQVFDVRLSDILRKAFDLRSDADYEIAPLPSPEEIESMLADMKQFVATIKAWLKTQANDQMDVP